MTDERSMEEGMFAARQAVVGDVRRHPGCGPADIVKAFRTRPIYVHPSVVNVLAAQAMVDGRSSGTTTARSGPSASSGCES
jgi:hypothetical protein